MANYVITSGANSFTFEVDGNYGEFQSGDLKPLVPVNGSNRILKIKDINHLLNTAGIIEKELIKIDLDVDTVDVDGVTSFANADALFLALKPVFFLANSSGGGNGWDAAVNTRNDLPTAVPPSAGSVYLVQNPVVILGVYTQYQSGLYIRQTETGALSDWRRLNVKVKFTASEFRVVDPSDASKQLGILVAGITTGITRLWTAQDKDIVVADDADLQVEATARQTGDEGSVTIHNDVNDAGSGAIITGQERTDINASIAVHSDVNLACVSLLDNTVLRFSIALNAFIPCLHQVVRSSTLLINNTNVFQNKINVNINIQRLVEHKITVSYNWSLNDTGQDFRAVGSLGGQTFQNVLTSNDDIHTQEPKDAAAADPDGRGTNQKHGFTKEYFVTPTSAGNNALILAVAGSANGDLASMWEASIEIEELVSVIGN